MINDSRASLFRWSTRLLARGRMVFSRDEAIHAIGVDHGAFLDAAERLQRQGLLIKPRRGFYVIVPPQFLLWGAPPPSWYIDDMMRFEGLGYYVGLLKASELRVPTQQPVMEFQVVTEKQLTRICAGRSIISFHYRKRLADVRIGVEDYKTDTGYMKVSSPELTALDLVRYVSAVGGLSNVAAFLVDLAKEIDAAKLARLSDSFERSVGQRLGYLLDSLGYTDRTGPMNASISARSRGWIELDPTETRCTSLSPRLVKRERKWHVVARPTLENGTLTE